MRHILIAIAFADGIKSTQFNASGRNPIEHPRVIEHLADAEFLDDNTGYQLYIAEGLSNSGFSSQCQKSLAATIQCHDFTRGFVELKYRSSPPTATLTPIVCNPTCGESLRRWFNGVSANCNDQKFGDDPVAMLGGRVWQGWNETCIFDPKTQRNCNGRPPHELVCSI
jgi:hypothetical protein